MLSHFPRTSSGRAPKEAVQEEKRFKAYKAYDYDSDEEERLRYAEAEEEPPRKTAPVVSFSGRCGLCKTVGHVSRDCPNGWFCDKCKWMHHKNDLCDQGAAKRAWKIAIDEKKGVAFLKAGGGGTSSS